MNNTDINGAKLKKKDYTSWDFIVYRLAVLMGFSCKKIHRRWDKKSGLDNEVTVKQDSTVLNKYTIHQSPHCLRTCGFFLSHGLVRFVYCQEMLLWLALLKIQSLRKSSQLLKH